MDNTNYTHTGGNKNNTYRIAPVFNGKEGVLSKEVQIVEGHKDSSWPIPYGYIDIPIEAPPDSRTSTGSKYTYLDNKGSYTDSSGKKQYYSGGANDASVGDVDGDGEYEIILKWDPTNSKDSASSGETGNVFIDAYEMTGEKLWRIDLGKNITAGAHYTQYIVYDFDGNGKAELAMKTAPGSIDGQGKYVTEASKIAEIKNADNFAFYLDTTSTDKKKGRILSGPEYLTIFNGETGAAMDTIYYNPGRGDLNSWGDDYGNRASRFVAGVGYLDGVRPSLIMCRGYYARTAVAVYDWDGENLKEKWVYDTGTNKKDPYFGQGNHQLSIADLDNDGCDEIINGSGVLENDGKSAYSTGWGHGDALHVTDFDNDGKQEIFSVLEDKPHWGTGYRDGDGHINWKKVGTDDIGRGIMANISKEHGVLAWSSQGFYDIEGNEMTLNGTSNCAPNFVIYWDGDLLRELLDGDKIIKWNDDTNSFDRLWTISNNNAIERNNGTKGNPCLQADLFGDWREEIIMRHYDNTALRVFFSLAPTDYKMPTLMHDSQYRCAVAWQNVGYNQPPHPSFFIGPDKTTYAQPNIDEVYPCKVDFNVSTVKGVCEGAEIWIGTHSVVTDSSGKASIPVGTGENIYKIVKNGYITAEGRFNVEKDSKEVKINRRLETKAESSITIEFKTADGVKLKDSEVINKAVDDTNDFEVSEQYKEDILSENGKVYEYAPDLSDSNSVPAGIDKTVKLVFTEKTVPGNYGKEIYTTNFSKDGYNANSEKHGYTAGAEAQYGALGKFKYGSYNIGDKDITINLPEGYTDFIAEFDMAYLDKDSAVNGGAIFGLTPFSGNSQGTTFGMRFTGQLVPQIGAVWGNANSTNNISFSGNISNNVMLHYILQCGDGKMTLTVLNKETGEISRESFNPGGLRNNVGSAERPVNKFKFMRVNGNGNVNIALSDFKVYTMDVPSETEWDYGENIFAAIPSETDISPKKAVFNTIDGKLSIDMSDKFVYEITDTDGNIADESKGISISRNKLIVSENASGEYYLVCKYKDTIIKRTKIVTADNGVSVEYVTDSGERLKESKINMFNAGDSFSLSDEDKEDIEFNGVTYEYNADLSSDTAFQVNGGKTVKAVFTKKVVPGEYDTNIYNTNFSKDGFSADSQTHKYNTNGLTAEYGDTDGSKYGAYLIGDKVITIDMPQGYTNFVTEFDMTYLGNNNDIADNSIFGITMLGEKSQGTTIGAGLKNASSSPEFASIWGGGKFGYFGEVPNGMLHYIIECNEDSMYFTVGNKNGEIIKSRTSVALRNNVGASDNPVKKIQFMRGYGAGNIKIGLSGLKVYKINGPTKELWPTEENIEVSVPSSTEISPTEFKHETDLKGYYVDLTKSITYSIVDSNGNVAAPADISVNENGILNIGANADITGGDYAVRCSYNGNKIRDIKISKKKNVLTVNYVSAGGIKLKESEVIENVSDELIDSKKDDILKGNITYEYSPNFTDESFDGKNEINLVFEEKRTFDEDIYRTYFAKNGFLPSSAKHGFSTEIIPDYINDSYGNKYSGYVIGDKGIDINLPKECTDFAVEFDMKYEETGAVPKEGSLFGITAYGKNGASGNTVGYLVENDGYSYAVSSENKMTKGKPADLSKTAHCLIVYNNNNIQVSIADKNTGEILQDKIQAELQNRVGASDNPVNKLSIRRDGDSGNGKLILGDLRVYKSNHVINSKWPYEGNVYLTGPSIVSFKPDSFEALAWSDYLSVDLSGGISYKITDKNGADFESEYLSIDDNGNLSVKKNAPEIELKVVCIYNGQEIKSFDAIVRPIPVVIEVNDFTDDNGIINFNASVISKVESKNAVIIAALYNSNGMLIDSEYKNASISTEISNYTFSLDKKQMSDTVLKIFIWESMDNMKPAFNVETFKKEIK